MLTMDTTESRCVGISPEDPASRQKEHIEISLGDSLSYFKLPTTGEEITCDSMMANSAHYLVSHVNSRQEGSG